MASRQRHQSPRPATNRRRRPTRYRRRPMETATRLAYRPFHQWSSGQGETFDERQAAHTALESLPPRQPAPVPKTRTASARASRIRPLTTGSELLRRCCGRLMQSWLAAKAADCRIGSINGQGPGFAGQAGAVSSLRCGPAAASRRGSLHHTAARARSLGARRSPAGVAWESRTVVISRIRAKMIS